MLFEEQAGKWLFWRLIVTLRGHAGDAFEGWEFS
jgi:hypothetical protein